jgi:hypothetical protein
MSSFCYSVFGKEDERSALSSAIEASEMVMKTVNRMDYEDSSGRISVCMSEGLEEADHDILKVLLSDLTPKAG